MTTTVNPEPPLFDPMSVPHFWEINPPGALIGRAFEFRLVSNSIGFRVQWRTVTTVFAFVVWRSYWNRGIDIYGNRDQAIGVLEAFRERQRERQLAWEEVRRPA